MTDRELCVVSAVGSDYAGGGSGLDLQRGSIRLVSAEERSCWRAGNRVSLTGTGGEIQAMAAGGSVTPCRGRKVLYHFSVSVSFYSDDGFQPMQKELYNNNDQKTE